MSRAELADLANKHLPRPRVDDKYVGALERGRYRWPSDDTRAALRAVLGVDNDTEIGFYITRPQPSTAAVEALSDPPGAKAAKHQCSPNDGWTDLGTDRDSAEEECHVAAPRRRQLASSALGHHQTDEYGDFPGDDADPIGHSWCGSDRRVNVDSMRRRTALALPVLAVASAMSVRTEPWSRVAYALERPEQLDEHALEHLEASTVELFKREEHTAARMLADDLRAHLAQLERLLRRPPADLERRLLITTGETLALAGWIAWDRQDTAAAEHHYSRAEHAARQAGDGPLLACVLAYRSYQAEVNGDLSGAKLLLSAAQGYLRGERSATSRSWVAAREAEVEAALTNETAALRSLDRALTVYDYAHPHRERAWTAFLTPTRLGSMAVRTYARLAHPDLDATTDSVVASVRGTDTKIKAIVLADAAVATIQGGRHERGARLAHGALDATLAHETSLGHHRLRDIRRVLRTNQDVPLLVELDDRLAAYVA